MESKKVISKKNLPTRSPILATVVYVLAMDYWNAPQWLWGAVGLLLIFIWIAMDSIVLHSPMVESTENISKEAFEAATLMEIQKCIYLRNGTTLTQEKVSKLLGVSLKTIQRFENYKSINHYLIWGYKNLFDEKTT